MNTNNSNEVKKIPQRYYVYLPTTVAELKKNYLRLIT